MHVGRPLMRALRSAVFAVACVLLSAGMHVLAGGAPVRVGTLLGVLAVVWISAFVLGGRQRGLGVLLGACFAAQYGMHHLFGVGATPAPAHGHGTGVGMLLVHVVMAVGSAWWLERGESALATLLRLAVTSIGLFLLIVSVEIEVPSRGPLWARPRAGRRREFASVVSRRGPPLPSVL